MTGTEQPNYTLAELQRDALAALPADDPLVVAVRRRFIGACEVMHEAARLLGIEPPTHATLRDRSDAWLYRTQRDCEVWARIVTSPLMRREDVAA